MFSTALLFLPSGELHFTVSFPGGCQSLVLVMARRASSFHGDLDSVELLAQRLRAQHDELDFVFRVLVDQPADRIDNFGVLAAVAPDHQIQRNQPRFLGGW